MEKGLRECCRSIRIGKILIYSDPMTNEARVLYAKLLPDISHRKVLLMYPIMSTKQTLFVNFYLKDDARKGGGQGVKRGEGARSTKTKICNLIRFFQRFCKSIWSTKLLSSAFKLMHRFFNA